MTIESRWVAGTGFGDDVTPMVCQIEVNITKNRLAVVRSGDNYDPDIMRNTFIRYDTHFPRADPRFHKTPAAAHDWLKKEATKRIADATVALNDARKSWQAVELYHPPKSEK